MWLSPKWTAFAAVRTYEVAVVLYDTEHRNAHHLCHLVGFHDDHAHQILRGRYDHYAVYRKRLENGQRNITGSWRHIDEEIVQVAPDDVGPELFTVPAMTGPLQMTGSSSPGSRRLMDITFTPFAATAG